MADRLKEIPAKILAWWKRFTTKQRSAIVGVAAAVIFTFAILIYFLSRPQYTQLMRCNTTSESSQVVEILESNSIVYKVSADALRIEVESSQISEANLALAAAGYVPDAYTLDDALESGLTTTASATETRLKLYLEKKLEADFEAMSMIRAARVTLDIPSQDGTIWAQTQKQEASAYIQLELDGTFTSANAQTLAKATATALGNATTANITIVDNDAYLWFAGGDDYSSAGIANSMQELQNQAQAQVANEVKKVLYGTHQYDNIEVASHLSMDYASYQDTVKEYYANDDRTEGMIANQNVYESENTSGTGGVPGTDSNNENTYVYQNTENNSSNESETQTQYLPNEHSRYEEGVAGAIELENSSISIAAIKYKKLREEDARSQGLLEGLTWEEYKSANDTDVRIEVDPDLYSFVANATGIAEDRITIVAYESPMFYDRERAKINATTVGSVILFVLIIGLLAFVVLRSMAGSKKDSTEEEELSVEDMLQSTPEPEIEDIDLEAKSETRKMIEKFVDDNPEAAAALLRNWLNEDWA